MYESIDKQEFSIMKYSKFIQTSYVVFILNLIAGFQTFGQVYTERQTRHRFAQLNLGIDALAGIGGTAIYEDASGFRNELDIPAYAGPRILIGGTHFWGHADFFIGIALFQPEIEFEDQTILLGNAVETAFRFYPWRIEKHRLRPFLGVSFFPYQYEARNSLLDYGDGPELTTYCFPLLAGATFQTGKHLFELGASWNFSGGQDYFTSRAFSSEIQLPAFHVSLGYKYILDTTISAEQDWESGNTSRVTEVLASRGELNSYFIGVGLSAAFWSGKSSYNAERWPFIEQYGTSILPDLTAGYYFHHPDLNLSFNYRGYSSGTSSYGVVQELSRKSIGIEVTKFLFDYHGFVPFAGPVLSYEHLSFLEEFEGDPGKDIVQNKLGWGLTFGWDIRPNRLQGWILRTNLRWYPDLKLEVSDNREVSFGAVEFNFIQLILYPGRFF